MPTITGTPGNDTLVGTADTDLIQGLGGNDTLIDSLGGDDTFDGGDDDDTIIVTRVLQHTFVTLIGGNGNDFLRYNSPGSAAHIFGGDGDDYLEADGGSFTVDGGAGNDRIYIRGNSNPVVLGSGQDTFGYLGSTLAGFHVTIADFTPGNGGDRIDWGATLAYLWGWDQSGNPFALGYLSLVQSGDIVAINARANPPAGGSGSNVIFMSGFTTSALTAFNLGGYASDGSLPANLVLTGTGANDSLNGAGGNDTVTGGAGNDVLFGGMGHDEIHGGDDNDSIDGWLGNDTITGDGGDDVIVDDYGFLGTIDGGTGNDTITADISKHPSLPLPQPAAPTMFQRVIDGGAGDDRITVIGYNAIGAQRVTEVTITGGADNDIIEISRTHASIDAGSGDDVVIVRNPTQTHLATVTLGTGVDTLRLADLNNFGGPIAAVTVTDFVAGPGGDVVDIPALLISRNFGWNYEGNPFAAPGAVRLLASGADTLVQGRTGGGPNDFLTLAVLQGVLPAAFTAENLGGYDPAGAPPAPQVVNGTPGDDTLAGGLGEDTVSGLAGDDILTGGFGDDVLNGGDDDDILDGQWADDTLNGGDGNDTLIDTRGGDDTFNGGDGNDIITATRMAGSSIFNVDGGTGNDTITLRDALGTVLGGDGNDVMDIRSDGSSLIVDGGSGNDDIEVNSATINAGSGDDIIRSEGGTQNVTLGAGKDLVTVQTSQSTLTIQDFQVGEEGDRLDLTVFGANPFGPGGGLIIEQIGADTRIRKGGSFPVTFLLKNVQATDLSTYNLGVSSTVFNPSARSFTGTPGPDEYISADGNDTLNGLGSDDTLYGAGGNDVIDGGAGADNMYGGTGNDIYFVDQADDEIFEDVGEGRDVVYASVSYTLAAGVSVEVMSTASQSDTIAIDLIGNELDQEIYGNAGANFLNGKGGTNYLYGLGGNDVYLVASANDHVVEQAGGGARDVVYALASYTLEAGVDIEVLSAADQAGTTPLELVGNELNQEIYGNAGANFLQGGGGTDYLIGLGGNDTYLVTGPGDNVVENVGEGTRDVIYATGNYAMAAGLNVEVLSSSNQAGTGAQNLTGSALGQEIYGNAGANVIDGGGGTDLLSGLAGNDLYYVDSADDYVAESAGGGRDVVYTATSYTLALGQEVEVLSTANAAAATAIDLTGNALANELYGNAGVNTLNGGAGADYLQGFGGADIFQFTTALGGGNVDALADFLSGTDKIALDDAVFTGLTPGVLPPGAFVAGSAAGDADDRIVYNSATGQLFFDADGNGAGVALLFATVQAGTVLVATDFMVI